MKILPFICLASLSLASCSTTVTEQVEETFPTGNPRIAYQIEENIWGEKHKIQMTEYYDSGEIRIQGALDDGEERTGDWKGWYKDGTVWSEGAFENGLREGIGTVYYRNGQQQMRGNYNAGKEEGLWSFWTETGQLQKEVSFESGQEQGPVREWYPTTGKLKLEGQYDQGKESGLWKFWYPSGILEKEVNYDQPQAP